MGDHYCFLFEQKNTFISQWSFYSSIRTQQHTEKLSSCFLNTQVLEHCMFLWGDIYIYVNNKCKVVQAAVTDEI